MELPFKKMTEVDTIYQPTCAFFKENYALPSRPVVIKNVANKWRAYNEWSLDFLRQRCANVIVRVSRFDDNAFEEMSLDDYFNYMAITTDLNPYYLTSFLYQDYCPELDEYLEIPEYFDCWTKHLPKEIDLSLKWLYIGPKHSGSGLHLDIMNTSAWNLVITGQKKWLFFPKSQENYIYSGKVNAFYPDFVNFPLLEQAEPLFYIQNPGDIIFTPSNWWHQVYNEKGGLSVTHNFVNETNYKLVEEDLKKDKKIKALEYLEMLKLKFLPSEE